MHAKRATTKLIAVSLAVVALTSTWASGQSSKGLVKRGREALAKNDLDRAIADFDRANRLDPGHPSPFYHRGCALQRKGDQDRAIADFDRAIRIAPEVAAPFSSCGYSGAGFEPTGEPTGFQPVEPQLIQIKLTYYINK